MESLALESSRMTLISLLAQFTDNTFQSGDIGLLAGSYAVDGVDILFDNFYADVP